MKGTEDVANIFKNFSDINFIYIVLILIFAWLIIFASQRLFPWIANKFAGRLRLFVLGLVPIVRLVVIIVAFILLVPQIINPSFENLVALLGALGLALGFAFKDYVSSLIAGVVTLYEMPYRPGDWIKIDGSYGEVKDINMRSVEIVTPDDTVVVIPHIKLWNSSIFNSNDGSQNLMCIADFYLQPDHDGAKVKHKLHDVALTSAYLQLDKPIAVIVMEKPWGTHYRLKAYPIDPRQQFDFITDLTIRGKEALNKMGVKFAMVPMLNNFDG
jgi:small-conductance mechanosensitive channel